MKRLILIISICAVPSVSAQQLSPVQLQTITKQIEDALANKKFDNAQTYITQMQQGGRAANAFEYLAKLANARQKEIEQKYQAELQKVTKAQATALEQAKKDEKTIAQLNTKLKEDKETANKQLLSYANEVAKERGAKREIDSQKNYYETTIATLRKENSDLKKQLEDLKRVAPASKL